MRARSPHTTVRTVPYTAVQSESDGDPLVSLRAPVSSSPVAVAWCSSPARPAVPLPAQKGLSGISAICLLLLQQSRGTHQFSSLRGALRRTSRLLWLRLTSDAPECPSGVKRQISRGKTRDFPSIYPSHIHVDLPYDFRVRCPTPPRPGLPCLVCASCSSGRKFAYSFLQTPPRGGCPCCSARSSRHLGLQRTLTS